MKTETNLIEAHIFRNNGGELEFLLLKRAKTEIYPGLWQMVTGSIEKNEKAFQTALREIKEETGITPVKFWIVPNVNSFYSEKYDSIYLIPVFAALANMNDEVRISEEHCEFKWVTRKDAEKMLVWPGQIRSLNIICDYFIDKKNFFDLVEITL